MTAAEDVAALSWWHTIDLGGGVVTPGGWDLRPTAGRIPWPAVEGRRCLDVGTMDGFWAFELERRGAGEVVAIDLVPARETFRLARALLDSGVEYRHSNVFDLDPAGVGRFDVIFAGYVLQMVPDPLLALRTLRAVCSGHLIVLDTVSGPLSLLPSPLARLDARRGHLEYFVFNRAGLVKAVSRAGFDVEASTRFLRDHPGPAIARASLSTRTRALHALGILGRSLALRARPGAGGR